MHKTIFITCYNTFISRNILASDAFAMLKNNPDLRLVVFVPPNKKDFIATWYGGPNVIVEALDLDAVIKTKKNKFWYRMAFVLQNTHYVRDQRKEHCFQSTSPFRHLNYASVTMTAALLSRLPFMRTIYRFFDYRYSPKNTLDPFIERYQPDLLFSTDAFSEQDALCQRSARRQRIPILSMVRSWDNPTTKGVLRIVPERILVNGPLTRDDLAGLHGIKPESIELTGIPQFDRWIQGPTLSREEFFARIGADSAKRLIIFAPAGSNLSDTDWQICEILKQALDKGELPDDVQFLVRNHPHHPADLSRFASDKRFIVEIPGEKFQKAVQTELRPEDQSHLLNSIYYSDIVVYITTSLGLDSAIFDKPQVIVSFDGWERKPYVRSVARYHNEDNLRSLIACNGTKVAIDAPQLIAFMNGYLNDPTMDRAGRAEIITRHLYKVDGQAGFRIGNAILAMLS